VDAHDPFQQFIDDRDHARRSGDGNADLGFLATADCDGRPTVRTLILRSVEARSIDLFCSASGAKWQDITTNGHFELLTWWPSCQRQYRLRGTFSALSGETLADSWHDQPRSSRLLDWYYTEVAGQGDELPSREVLLEGIAELARVRFPAEPLPLAPAAVGMRLTADAVEVLHLTGPGRLHDRRAYHWHGTRWSMRVLVP
jgi:pyridoxamine 5'-phosphate oxidase